MSHKISRRQFLAGAAGLQLGFVVTRLEGQWTFQKLIKGPIEAEELDQNQEPAGISLTTWIEIAATGAVTITAAAPDIGQGVRTATAMLVAEELGVKWEDVRVKQAPAGSEYGHQFVGGSGTMGGAWEPMRVAGAAGRVMLIAAAADRWGVPERECEARDSAVFHTGSSRSLSFGELASDAASMPPPSGNQIQLKPLSDFKIIGKATARVDNADVVTGRAVYGTDTHVEGMRFAVIDRPIAFWAHVEDFDASAAMAVPGVTHILPDLLYGIVVVAENTWAAIEGRKALNTKWNTSANEHVNSTLITSQLSESLGRMPSLPGSVLTPVEATFTLPFLAHATMEPMNCTVKWENGQAEVWAACQSPMGIRRVVAEALSVSEDRVKVNVTLAGGGFGRRADSEYAGEAAQIAKEVGGTLQLLWTRDDDMRHDRFRPASHHGMQGGLDAAGRPLAWRHRMAIATSWVGDSPDGGIYDIPGFGRIDQEPTDAMVPTMVWRSVNHSQVTFAEECFIDMLAHAAEEDPVAFRRQHLGEDRLRPLLERAAAMIEWDRDRPARLGRRNWTLLGVRLLHRAGRRSRSFEYGRGARASCCLRRGLWHRHQPQLHSSPARRQCVRCGFNHPQGPDHHCERSRRTIELRGLRMAAHRRDAAGRCGDLRRGLLARRHRRTWLPRRVPRNLQCHLCRNRSARIGLARAARILGRLGR